jgi:murein DD-endopeptidase MepM/ murein hydrolase activator NlpD
MIRSRFAFLLLATLPLFAWALPRNAPVPGGVSVMVLGSASGTRPTVTFNDLPQPVLRHQGKWTALIGIPLDAAVGEHRIRVVSGNGERELPLRVTAKHYPTQNLRFADSRMVTPPPELEARIIEEQRRISEWKRHFSNEPEPETRFDLPASGPRSSRFGLRRVLNGEARSPHAGLDVAVGVGAPLRAPAAGTVLAVADLYFAGKTVVIDHGRGVLTLYAHLSRVDVAEGQTLARGEPFGASGVSGRITGPHLHWGVIVGGSAVDPELFLSAK